MAVKSPAERMLSRSSAPLQPRVGGAVSWRQCPRVGTQPSPAREGSFDASRQQAGFGAVGEAQAKVNRVAVDDPIREPAGSSAYGRVIEPLAKAAPNRPGGPRLA